MLSLLYMSTILFIFCDLSSVVDTVGVGSPCVAGGEDGGPEDNSSRLYHNHIRTYWMFVVCACLQNMMIGPMYVYGLKVPAALFLCTLCGLYLYCVCCYGNSVR